MQIMHGYLVRSAIYIAVYNVEVASIHRCSYILCHVLRYETPNPQHGQYEILLGDRDYDIVRNSYMSCMQCKAIYCTI